MPNIPKERYIVDSTEFGRFPRENKADLTYTLYVTALRYVAEHGHSYANLSDAKACLRDAADEIQWRLMIPNEKFAEMKNGRITEEEVVYQQFLKRLDKAGISRLYFVEEAKNYNDNL